MLHRKLHCSFITQERVVYPTLQHVSTSMRFSCSSSFLSSTRFATCFASSLSRSSFSSRCSEAKFRHLGRCSSRGCFVFKKHILLCRTYGFVRKMVLFRCVQQVVHFVEQTPYEHNCQKSFSNLSKQKGRRSPWHTLQSSQKLWM